MAFSISKNSTSLWVSNVMLINRQDVINSRRHIPERPTVQGKVVSGVATSPQRLELLADLSAV